MTAITDKARETLVYAMTQLDTVQWDRLIVGPEGEVQVYGWVAREHDCRSDFALIRVTAAGDGHVVTSSPKLDLEVTEKLNPTGEGEVGCQRVENVLPEVPNVVRL